MFRRTTWRGRLGKQPDEFRLMYTDVTPIFCVLPCVAAYELLLQRSNLDCFTSKQMIAAWHDA